MPRQVPRVLSALLLVAATAAQAQDGFPAPRTPYGVPDLQGVWRNATVTPLSRSDEPIFEYACHEGNYALPGTLAGARVAEREAAAAKED